MSVCHGIKMNWFHYATKRQWSCSKYHLERFLMTGRGKYDPRSQPQKVPLTNMEIEEPRIGPKKILRIGMLGEPNAGKSTFVNSVVGSKVSIISEIMNTTRESIYVPHNKGNTQLVFIDTPGIVPFQEARRLKLGRMQITAPRKVIDECDILAVMVDLQSRRKRERIHECILDLINEHPKFPCILILNKVDLIKRKSSLLKYTSILTQDRKTDIWGYEHTGGYSGFKHVFMVSASRDDGIQDVVDVVNLLHFGDEVERSEVRNISIETKTA